MAVYLDYNATAPVRPQAIETMQEMLQFPANPSSVHSFGRLAKKHLENARKTIAAAVSAFPDEIIFTGSGTEANATVLAGFPDRHILISAVEHSSLIKGRPENSGVIPVDGDGIVDLAALDALLAGKTALVSVMFANNETGVIQPIAEIAALCKKHGALMHCDAVQALGKVPVDFGQLGVDMMTLSAHKSGGPVGAAALVVRRNLPFQPFIRGGGQESNRRAGTHNLAAVAGFAKAIELYDFAQMQRLRGWLGAMEQEFTASGAHIFGTSAPRTPNTSSVAMPGVGSEVQLIDFDLKGFCVSAGSACTSGRSDPSHVLSAMGAGDLAGCTIRVSGGWNTTEDEIKKFTQAWKSLSARLKQAA